MKHLLIFLCLVSLATKLSSCENQTNAESLLNDKNIDKLKEQNAELTKENALLKVQILEGNASSCLAFGNSTGIHVLNVPGIEPFLAPCDSRFKGDGWTVIQRRLDGSVSFERSWNEYRNGFGDLNGEFFIGLEKLHKMTIAQNYDLYIVLEDTAYRMYSVSYNGFRIESEKEDYMLNIRDKTGYYDGISDALSQHSGNKFTTFDRANDNYLWGNCAKVLTGGWWFGSCYKYQPYKEDDMHSNLNGIWGSTDTQKRIRWPGLSGYIKSVQMMIRPTTQLL